jgi:hypothetical protein
MHNSIPNLTSALLVSSTLAAAGLLPRQQTDANSSSPEYRDPHLAPPVTADYPFGPIANGGVAWGAAFGKAKGMVDQMTVEEKVNVVRSLLSLHRPQSSCRQRSFTDPSHLPYDI